MQFAEQVSLDQAAGALLRPGSGRHRPHPGAAGGDRHAGGDHRLAGDDFDPTSRAIDRCAGRARAARGTIAPKYDTRVFFALVLAVESCALFLFLATDVFLFYVFFEVILIPMYFLIGGFGPGPRRTYAAAKFLIFGLLGGFVMLASVIGLYVQSAKVGRGRATC